MHKFVSLFEISSYWKKEKLVNLPLLLLTSEKPDMIKVLQEDTDYSEVFSLSTLYQEQFIKIFLPMSADTLPEHVGLPKIEKNKINFFLFATGNTYETMLLVLITDIAYTHK